MTVEVGIPAQVVDDDSVGTLTWSFDSTYPNGLTATTEGSTAGATLSHYIRFDQFGFSLTGATSIDQIQVFVSRVNNARNFPVGNPNVADNTVSLIVESASVPETVELTGPNKADTDNWTQAESFEEITYTWAAADCPSIAEVTDSLFGLVIAVDIEDGYSYYGTDYVGLPQLIYCTMIISYFDAGGVPKRRITGRRVFPREHPFWQTW